MKLYTLPLGEGKGDPGLIIMGLAVDSTDAELADLMRVMRQRRKEGVKHVRCIIGGYDEDPRELWEIPEVAEFCKRLIQTGFISWLDGGNMPSQPFFPVLGAAEVILISEGRMTNPIVWTLDLCMELIRKWTECNARADSFTSSIESN